jgi:hypothetical protein
LFPWLGLNYRIVYKKGIDNGAVDALSRKPPVSKSCYTLSSCHPL